MRDSLDVRVWLMSTRVEDFVAECLSQCQWKNLVVRTWWAQQNGKRGIRDECWTHHTGADLSSESKLSRLRSEPQENAHDPRKQARTTSKQPHKLQTVLGRRTNRKGIMPPMSTSLRVEAGKTGQKISHLEELIMRTRTGKLNRKLKTRDHGTP